MQDGHRGVGGFVVVNLGVGHSRVVIDDGVYEGVPQLRLAVSAAADPGPQVSILLALGSAHEPLTATCGYVAQLLDIDVDQRSRVIMFVPADWLTGTNVDVRQTIQSASDQHSVHSRGRHR